MVMKVHLKTSGFFHKSSVSLNTTCDVVMDVIGKFEESEVFEDGEYYHDIGMTLSSKIQL